MDDLDREMQNNLSKEVDGLHVRINDLADTILQGSLHLSHLATDVKKKLEQIYSQESADFEDMDYEYREWSLSREEYFDEPDQYLDTPIDSEEDEEEDSEKGSETDKGKDSEKDSKEDDSKEDDLFKDKRDYYLVLCDKKKELDKTIGIHEYRMFQVIRLLEGSLPTNYSPPEKWTLLDWGVTELGRLR